MENKHLKARKASGLKACDYIIISDDDETDTEALISSNLESDNETVTEEILSINIENDDESSTEYHQNAPDQASVAGVQQPSFQPVADRQSPHKNQNLPAPARHTEKVSQPLFRVLTKDDLTASRVQSVPESCSMGFKAWYKTHDSSNTGNAAPVTTAMQQKRLGQKPSITLVSGERTPNMASTNRDAPNFTMNVLTSKRKRTIAELGYNELISPSQVVSPLEKLAHAARKRRKREGMSDLWSDKTSLEEGHTAIEIDQAYGRESVGMAKEDLELNVLPIMRDLSERQEPTARVGNERSQRSVTRETCLVSSNVSTNNRRISTQEHDGSNNLGLSRGKASCRKRNRVGGPTSVCGVFSPEKRPPVKRAGNGSFHCPRCDSTFTRSQAVDYHFEGCIVKYGNPRGLKWDDHPSLADKSRRVVLKNEDTQISTGQARISAGQRISASERQRPRPVDRPAPTTSNITTSPLSSIEVSDVLKPLEKQSAAEESRVCLDNESKVDHHTTAVGHRILGGKSLSAETLKTWQTGICDDGDDSHSTADEDQYEESELPDIAYRYSVQRREWLETEDDALEKTLGPYHTLNEANAVAEAEVQCPQIDGFDGVQPKGWSYHYEEDEYGMQTHKATVLDISIEAVVHRELAPANERVSIPKSAFVVAQRVYIVHELQWVPSPDSASGQGPSHCQSLTHGVYTLLKRANLRAAAEYAESLTGDLGETDCDMLRKMEAKGELEKKARALTGEGESFCEQIDFDSGGFAKVWVELVVVEGPRN